MRVVRRANLVRPLKTRGRSDERRCRDTDVAGHGPAVCRCCIRAVHHPLDGPPGCVGPGAGAGGGLHPFPRLSRGRVRQRRRDRRISLDSGLRRQLFLDDRRAVAHLRTADQRHRHPDRALFRRLPEGPSAPRPLPVLHPDVHGLHARTGAFRQFPDAVRLLGADVDHFLPADRFRSRARGFPAGGGPGAGRHGGRGARSSGRAARPLGHHRRHPDVAARAPRPAGAAESLVPAGARPRPVGRLHQVGAVAAAFLAAERDGGADARVGLPALRHHGEGRRLSC